MPSLSSFLPIALVLALTLATPLAAAPPEQEDDASIVLVRTDDPEMRAAIAEARRTLPRFLALLAKPPEGTSGFSFKYPLGGTEHIWVEHIERRGNTLVGQLANVPLEDGYRQGQRVTVPLAEVSDWAYRDAQGVVHGHRTTRALLPRLEADYARQVRAAMGWRD